MTAVALGGAAGCTPGSSQCSYALVDAIAVDPVDPSVVTVAADGAVSRAANGKRLWASLPDGVPAGLLPTPDGGVVALNVGAAARRFDAAGDLLWTVGYGASVGDVGALLGDDLLLADADAVRLIDPTGAPVWSRALGAGAAASSTRASVTAAVADGAGGAWILGTFDQAFPPWVGADTPPEMGPAGPFLVTPDTPLEGFGNGNANPFLLHLDASGAILAGGAWRTPVAFSQAVMAAGDAGQPVLVARGQTSDSWPLMAAFDATGALLWARRSDGVAALAVDGAGTLFAISTLVGDTPAAVQVQHWDAAGALRGSVPAPVTLSPAQSFEVATTPTTDGFVAAGAVVTFVNQGSYELCTPHHAMFQFQTQTMTATSMPLVGL